jgi:autoinducer 2-degrading protein
MHIVYVQIAVKPEHVAAFVAATRDNHLNTRQEAGNLRFDVIRLNDDPTRFRFYEAYRDQAAFAAHQQTAHYHRWKAAVEPWMAGRRTSEKGTSVMPEPWV